ncbi:hypothetical protein AWB78_08484 [Caballeronia calidae]|uniref:Uncharacterized protein n=1 Tax=Caballeronia calidae TaxID=1777139 RepID=A0A158EK34_9BURK|nr:hypothetical protein [Caballeronia calidae]SAL07228.1 hypothetical protein AWB78_08484 [Caballeronia calidae]
MIPPEMATIELAKAEAEIAKWEKRVAEQQYRIQTRQTNGIELELAKQILQTFEAALKTAQAQRDRLVER